MAMAMAMAPPISGSATKRAIIELRIRRHMAAEYICQRDVLLVEVSA